MEPIYGKLCAGDTPGRKEADGAWLRPSLYKGGDRMTDYELIVLVIMIVTLAFSIHNGNPKG